MSTKTLRRELLVAIAMVIVAAIALGSSTYAWFANNNTVTATGMSVKAQAEGGIVIANESLNDWSTSTTASHQTAELYPTSTKDTINWYHANSDLFNDAKANQEAKNYTKLTTNVADGIGYTEESQYTESGYTEQINNYYLVNKFFIKSAAAALNPTEFYIKTVTVTGQSTSEVLDASLRVAVVIGGQTYIYAPVSSTDGQPTLSYKVAYTDDVTATLVPSNKIVNTKTTITSIPDNTAKTESECVEADVFLYFEGEDANCKSSNIKATFDKLDLTVTFGTEPAVAE